MIELFFVTYFARYRPSHGDGRLPVDPGKDLVLDPELPVTHTRLYPLYITIVTCSDPTDPKLRLC